VDARCLSHLTLAHLHILANAHVLVQDCAADGGPCTDAHRWVRRADGLWPQQEAQGGKSSKSQCSPRHAHGLALADGNAEWGVRRHMQLMQQYLQQQRLPLHLHMALACLRSNTCCLQRLSRVVNAHRGRAALLQGGAGRAVFMQGDARMQGHGTVEHKLCTKMPTAQHTSASVCLRHRAGHSTQVHQSA